MGWGVFTIKLKTKIVSTKTEANERHNSWDVIGLPDRLNYWVHTFNDKLVELL